MVAKFMDDCKLCPLVHLVLNNNNPARKLANSLVKGPDEFVPLSLSDQPLSVIQIDETGPIYLGKDGYFIKVWVLLAVEIVTRLVYLVPLKSQGTVDLIKALDILQNRRGKLSRIVVDQLTGHVALKPKKNNQNAQPTVKNTSPKSIKTTVAEGQI